jgi:hypothetical protein
MFFADFGPSPFVQGAVIDCAGRDSTRQCISDDKTTSGVLSLSNAPLQMLVCVAF